MCFCYEMTAGMIPAMIWAIGQGSKYVIGVSTNPFNHHYSQMVVVVSLFFFYCQPKAIKKIPNLSIFHETEPLNSDASVDACAVFLISIHISVDVASHRCRSQSAQQDMRQACEQKGQGLDSRSSRINLGWGNERAALASSSFPPLRCPLAMAFPGV